MSNLFSKDTAQNSYNPNIFDNFFIKMQTKLSIFRKILFLIVFFVLKKIAKALIGENQ